jgi:hypothetical protein
MRRRHPSRTLRRRIKSVGSRFALRPADSRVTKANLAQAGVTIVVAAALAVATLLGAAATGAWQQSLREELKRSAALVEDVHHVYGDEAPLALELALAKARAAELSPTDAIADRKAVFAVEQKVGGEHLIDDRYERPEGYDVLGRLADVRERHPDLMALDPELPLERGDRLSRRALIVLIATVPLVLGFLLWDLITRRRMKTADATPRRDDEDLELVPRPWSAPGRRRFGAFVALAAWLVVTLVPSLHLFYANQEQRAQSLAARKAAEVSSLLQASGVVSSFAATSQQRVVWLHMRATGQELAANITLSNTGSTEAAARLAGNARTEAAVAMRAARTVAAMSRLPTSADRVDFATRRAVSATPAGADARRKEQNAETDRAQRAGARSNRVTVALLLGALAVSLGALSHVARSRRPSLLDLGAASVLGMSLIALASVPSV